MAMIFLLTFFCRCSKSQSFPGKIGATGFIKILKEN